MPRDVGTVLRAGEHRWLSRHLNSAPERRGTSSTQARRTPAHRCPSAPDAAGRPAVGRVRKWFRGMMLNRANALDGTPGETPFWGWHGSFIRSGSLAGEPTSRRTVRRPLDQTAQHMWSCREARRAQRAPNSPDSVRADGRCPKRGRAPARDPIQRPCWPRRK